MPNFDKILGGIGILIFVYLLFNAPNVKSTLEGVTSLGTRLIGQLQGQKSF